MTHLSSTPTTSRPGRKRMIGAMAAAAVAVSTLTGLVAAPSAQAATSPASESSFVKRINSARHADHRANLATSSHLNSVARSWALKMAGAKTLKHNPKLTKDVGSFRFVGENVGVGNDVAGLHSAFMNSPAHRANVLDRDYTQIGVGVVTVNGRMWVAEVFRKPVTTTKKVVTKKKVTKKKAPAVLKYGSRGKAVAALQRKLHIRADGRFGPQTRSHLKAWQRKHHLSATGTLNATTRRALHL